MSDQRPLRIGIDVGGTNTDAVALDGRTIVAAAKTPTTRDITEGIYRALEEIRQAGFDGHFEAVMLGTTHFANAVVERRRLEPTAAIRLCLPAALCLPPMVDWPQDLVDVLGEHSYVVGGGYEFDGRELAPVDEGELRKIGRRLRDDGIGTAAVSCVFSPLNDEQEALATQILTDEHPDLVVTRSCDIGRVGILERENAAILNASLVTLARQIVTSFEEALRQVGIDAPFFFTQNDGTLMSSEFAARFPVLTFSSGPTNSMRGAAFLTGLKQAVVVDIGGTTTDVGMLLHGFPREASTSVQIGDVRTNFRMPDVYTFGLGGGSMVRRDPLGVGPQSVGYEITERALVFGGDTLTATDVAVAAGRAELGDAGRLDGLAEDFVGSVCSRIDAMIEEAVDRMKTTAEAIPVITVGGGSILASARIAGASEVLKPEHFEVANAIGAAIAQVGGEADKVYSLDEVSREDAIADIRRDAINRAVEAGALESMVEIVDMDEIPIAYLPSNATRMRAKAVGELRLEARQ